MRSFKDRGLRPASAFAAVIVVGLPALLAAGCAAPTAQYPQANWYAGGPVPAEADPAVAAARAKVQAPATESDGLPEQMPPRLAARAMPDDPSEPWSPNYGGPADKRAIPANPTGQTAAADSEHDQATAPAGYGASAQRTSWQSGN